MPQQATVSVLTLGCKLNQADAEAMARRLMAGGVRVVARPEEGTDAVVINTCSITHVADRKARHLTRLARRLSPGATIVLTGCYAETAPDNAAQLTGADLVLGNAAKPEIPDLLLERLRQRREAAVGCPTPVEGGLRTRAFVKIQEGCDEVCAFCIVPRTRGRERSRTVEEVVQVVNKDTLFYRNSGGGVTVSGGEPTHQAEFVKALLARCQESGRHTALDTGGLGEWEDWAGVAPGNPSEWPDCS